MGFIVWDPKPRSCISLALPEQERVSCRRDDQVLWKQAFSLFGGPCSQHPTAFWDFVFGPSGCLIPFNILLFFLGGFVSLNLMIVSAWFYCMSKLLASSLSALRTPRCHADCFLRHQLDIHPCSPHASIYCTTTYLETLLYPLKEPLQETL